MKGSKHFIFFIVVWLWIDSAAQVSARYHWVDEGQKAFRYRLKDTHDTQAGLLEDLKDWRAKAFIKGYSAASIDTLKWSSDSSSVDIYLFVGKALEYNRLLFDSVETDILRKTGVDKQKRKPLDVKEVEARIQQILMYYANHGYPFAQVEPTKWLSDSTGHVLVCQVNQNDFIVFDTLIVRGEANIKRRYLERYLGLLEGQPYSERKINRVNDRLTQLSFVNVVEDPSIVFKPGKASVVLNLEKQRANEVNFILGFLPNDQLDSDRKLTITGDGMLNLVNSFGVGEEFAFAFKQIKPRTQDLEISAAYPFIANFPIGAEGWFHLYRNDSLFSQLGGRVSLDFRPAGNDKIGVFFENFTSNALTIDTQAIQQNEALPNILDVRNNTYGISLAIQRLNDAINPTKGRALSVRLGVGTKRVIPRFEIENLLDNDGNPLDLYKDLTGSSVQYKIALDWQRYTPLGKRLTFLTAYRAGFFIAKNVLQNEMYRIGGANLLRGFDEQTIFTPHYQVATTEIRVLLGKRSYAQAFLDLALVEDATKRDGSLDVPLGFGVGAALSTNGGMFRISYALGRQLNQPIRFRNGKIHFGYVNVF